MSTGHSPGVEQVLHAWRSLQTLTQQLRSLAHESEDSEAFFSEFLPKVAGAVNAIAAAVWARDAQDQWRLHEQFQLQQALASADQAAAHRQLLAAAAEAEEPLVIVPGAESGQARLNPTQFVAVAAPVRDRSRNTRFIVEIFEKAGRPASIYSGHAQFLAEMCQVVADFASRQAMRAVSARQEVLGPLQEFVSRVHGQLDLSGVCFAIANEGRRLVGCDRLSIAVLHRGKYQVEAISGQDVFDKRSDAVRALNHLAGVMAAVREPLWYHGISEDLPPQVEQAVQEYVDLAESRLVVVLPLQQATPDEKQEQAGKEPPPLLGLLIIEQFTSDALPEGAMPRLEAVSHQSTLALRNALEHRGLFLMPVWKWLGGTAVVQRTRRWPKFALIGGIILAVLALLFVIPADFALEGDGQLEPIHRQDVFAATSGVVKDVYVKHGQHVRLGDKLVQLQNVDLEVERARLTGEAAAALERLTSVRASLLDGQRLEEAERARLAGEEAQLRQQLISLKLQLTLFETRLDQLSIKSPIEGEVTTWDVRNLLANRPVQPGQLLLTVARTDADWELLVRMPEVRMGHVLDAWRESKGEPLPVTIMLASEPGNKYQGRLVEVHDRAEEDPQEGSTVLLKVLFDKSQLQHPRSGAAALVKVHCGRRSLGYVWFHDIWEFFESRVFF